ncbi:MAG TPA: hypothetical protein VFN38_00015 [Gemmatimonadaceae bacterium]|nr:hypothetical protein [Gemmatimonadaceae bacterium]
MTDEKRNPDATDAQRARGRDQEAELERELRRESQEGADSIGDMSENRNVSGSSTWETLNSRPADEEGRGEVF